VLDQAGQSGPGGREHLAHAAAGEPDAQRQGVDEHAYHGTKGFAILQAARQHRAEYDIVAAGKLGDHLGPGDMEQGAGG
nr:hypothetical protein [Tanacetum cinerariifolium]